MTKKSDAPAIRFKGFSDAWEQRKFDEVFDCTVPNNTLSRAELSYDEGTVLNVHYGDVLIKYGSVLDVQKDDIPRIPHRCREDFNGALLQDGDVIIADTAEDETTGKACEIGNLQGSAIVSGLHTMVCRPRNRMALGYLGYYLNSNAYHHQLLPLMQGIKVLSLSRSNIQKTSVSYPIAVKEQQLIAYYFSQLDNLITLHQRKFEKLTNVKKSMLEKMFPQNGSSYPEIRFKGFTDPWEQRKAKEICSIGTGKSNTQDQVDDGKYPFYIRSDVPVRSNKYLYDCEAVITIGDGNIGKVFHYVNGKFDLHQRCYKMTDFKDIWGKYFFYYFSTKFYDRAMKMTAKATVDSVRLEMISEMDIKKPPQISEQKQIAEFFANLDNLITLHQRKCANLCSPSQVVFSLLFATSTFSWEQRKAIDIADYSKGKGYSKGDLTDAGTPIILYGRLYTKYQFAISEVDTFAFPRNGAVYSQGNEVIVPASGETAEDIARASAVEKSGVLLGGDLNILRPFDFINPLFLALAISNGEPQKELAKKAQGKSVVHIHNTDIQEVTIAYPSRTEQDRIVSVFRQLDNLITLHQRECISFTGRADKLILTANKKRTTSSWEQRKLGDIGKARSGVGFPDADQGGVTGVPFFKVSDMNLDGNENEMIVANNYVTAEQIADHRWSPITELPAIFFAKVGAAVMLNRKRLCRFPFLLDNNTMAYSLTPTKWDADFAKALFGTVDLTSLVQVGALPSYNAGDVESMGIYLPSLFEQEQIGAFFKLLDNLITLHQRKPFLMKWRTSDANRNQTNRLVL